MNTVHSLRTTWTLFIASWTSHSYMMSMSNDRLPSMIPNDREISWGPREISKLEGMYSLQPQLEAVYGHSPIIYPSQGMYQELHLYRAIVRINILLVTMREWLLRCVNIHRTVWGYFLIFTASVWTNEKNWIKPFPQSISSYVFCLLPFCPQLHKTVYRCKSATLLACNVSFKVLTKAWPSWEKPLKSFVNSDQTWWDSGKSRAYKSWSIMM